jgi:uncharacterized protein YjiS (DUF1127 family)
MTMNLFDILTRVYAIDTTPAAHGFSYLEARSRAGEARAEVLARGTAAAVDAALAVGDWVRKAILRHRTYTQLMRLDDRLLRDIGVDRSGIAHVVEHLTAPAANDNRHVRAA